MTDVSTTAPIASRRLNRPRLSFPRLEIGASLIAILGLVGDGLKMAYVDPYTSLYSKPHVIPDDDLEGRDPTW